jgi:hypothetical protein
MPTLQGQEEHNFLQRNRPVVGALQVTASCLSIPGVSRGHVRGL